MCGKGTCATSPAARDLISVERVIMRAHKPDHLRTHVVCPGMVYGGGEDDLGLHPLFKLVFESPDDPLKLLTPGANVLPLIHIADLVAYVQGVLSGAPPERYLLACEPGRATGRSRRPSRGTSRSWSRPRPTTAFAVHRRGVYLAPSPAHFS